MKRKTKTIMSVLSAFFVLAGILSFAFLSVKAEGNVAEIFPDVKEGAWYVKFVQYVYDNGIMAGNKDGTFGPDKPLLREQFSQVLYSMAGKPGVAANAANPFTDVKNNPGYPRDAILWAYENGIASGNADRTFGVGSRIQRQAVASMLYKYASANGYDLSSNDNALSGFSDSSKVETWAVTSMKWAVSQGIVTGKSGRLDPAGTATRAECAAMIMQLLNKNENVHRHVYDLKIAEEKYLKSAASCTKPAEYYFSCECGEYTKNKSFESGKALGHIWDNGTVTKEATEDEEGVKTYHCTRTGCNETKTEAIPKLPHTHSYTLKVTDSKYLKSAASCTKPAEYYFSCKCGDYTKDSSFTSGNALGHKWDNGTVTKEATEDEEGVKTYHCTRTGCNETKTEEIPKLPHTHSYTLQVAESKYLKSAATCTKPAVYYYSCKCGEFTKSKTFESGEALGHKWDNGTVTKEATEEEEGVLTYHCTRTGCSATKTEAIPKVAVTPLYDWHSILDFTEPVTQEENPEERMSHNIYSDPVLNGTSGKYSGFLIDFCSDHAATSTYWALCNWYMDISDFKSKHTVLDPDSAAGAYAGLQNRPDGKKAIMSFWEVKYLDENNNEQSLRAKRIYPEGGDTNQFDGEGEGSNYITDYYWRTGKWYRMYICCYDDATTGHTFVEQWVMDIEKGVWTKISCFDTGLCHSYFKGAMSQFMENYGWEYSNEVRTFAYRNMYVREYDTGEWKYINQSELVVDTWWDNKKGNFAFTADGNTLYGITCGYGPDTAALNDDIRRKYTISSTSGPVTP